MPAIGSTIARMPDNDSRIALELRVLKTPPQSPQTNAHCERLLDTLRRECLDYLILLTEDHLRYILKTWVPHYNTGLHIWL